MSPLAQVGPNKLRCPQIEELRSQVATIPTMELGQGKSNFLSIPLPSNQLQPHRNSIIIIMALFIAGKFQLLKI